MRLDRIAISSFCLSMIFSEKPVTTFPNHALSPARRTEHPRQQPDRNDDRGAEQEVAPQPVDGVKAEIPDPLKQKPDAVDDIPGVEANSGKHHPDQDRQQDQPKCHRQRRASEKAVQAIVGRRQFPCIVWHSMISRTNSLAYYSQCWGDGEPASRRQWPLAAASCFDAFSSREPVSTPDRVRGHVSLENAMAAESHPLSASAPAFPADRPRVAACPSAAG